jgi:threonine dehydrogenase-like Zn-dependent dehydrogenase
MKTLVAGKDHSLSVREIPLPGYNDCQALVKMLACGVCSGTDTKLIHGAFKNFDAYPAALGHEGVGRVVETGKNVTGLKEGDVVLLPFLEGKTGEVYPGWGAYSEYAVVGDLEAYTARGKGPGTPGFPENYFAQTKIKPTDKVDPVEATMIVTYREVLSAAWHFGFKPNEKVLVFGAGPVGLCFVKFAALLGLETVIAAVRNDEKAKAALEAGASYAFNSRKCNLTEEVRKLCPGGVDYVVDAAGSVEVINQGMELIRDRGKICVYGISPELAMNLDWSRAPYNWTLVFQQMPSKKEEGEAHRQILSWINMGILKPKDLISDVFDFDHILDAFKLVEARKSATKKIVIRY